MNGDGYRDGVVSRMGVKTWDNLSHHRSVELNMLMLQLKQRMVTMAIKEIEAKERETRERIESLLEREHEVLKGLGRALLDGDTIEADQLRSDRDNVREQIEDCFLMLPHIEARIRAACGPEFAVGG